MPLLIDGVGNWSDHVLTLGWCGGHIRQQFFEGFAFDRAAIAVQQAGIQQLLHHLRNATGSVQIHRDVSAAGLQVTEHRNALADALEVINAQLNTCRASDGQQMQHGVGGSTHRHDHADGVFECLLGE